MKTKHRYFVISIIIMFFILEIALSTVFIFSYLNDNKLSTVFTFIINCSLLGTMTKLNIWSKSKELRLYLHPFVQKIITNSKLERKFYPWLMILYICITICFLIMLVIKTQWWLR